MTIWCFQSAILGNGEFGLHSIAFKHSVEYGPRDYCQHEFKPNGHGVGIQQRNV